MFTVRHEKDGVTRLHHCSYTEHVDKFTDPGGNGYLTLHRGENELPLMLTEGTAYVMNEAGQTVGVFYLRKPEPPSAQAAA